MSNPFRSFMRAAMLCATITVIAHGCGDANGTEMPAATTTTIGGADGTSIDRSNSASGEAPGDGSGQGKTPEGNSNSGDSPNTSVSR
jgi:hypothetical protein